MMSKFILVAVQALTVSAGFQDALGYTLRPPMPTGPVPGAVERRQNPGACTFLYSALNYCKSVSPGFVDMAETRQAPCLCYSSTAWVPSIFDGAVRTCASYAKTASPTDYSAIAGLNGFCSSIGDIRTAGGGGGSTPTACSVVGAALSYCESVSPGFTTMPVSRQAPCLCYSSTSWIPQFFDGQINTCASFAKTAEPTDYSVLNQLQGFCSSAGDVFAVTTPIITTPRTTATPTPTDTPTTPITTPRATVAGGGIATNTACAFVSSAVSYCNSVSPGFTTMNPTLQAPCLCYSSTAWKPNGFDGPISTCAEFVKTADPGSYSIYQNLEGFCSGVGDVLAQTTGGGGGGGSGGGASSTGSVGGGGGVGGGEGGIGATAPGGARSTTTPTVPRTTTVLAPGVSTTSQPAGGSAGFGMRDGLLSFWAWKLAGVSLCMFALF